MYYTMQQITFFLLVATTIWMGTTTGCRQTAKGERATTSQRAIPQDSLRYPGEKHLRNIRQLTFGGNNAEAYFSFDNSKLVFQSDYKNWGVECDQIFVMGIHDDTRRNRPQMISTGKGRTTCAFFLPGDTLILYASTHEGGEACPPVPERPDGKYVWPIYDDYDIYVADLQGRIVKKLTDTPGYDAEATVSPQGDKIVFTSMRTGDLVVQPTEMEIFVINTDGTGLRQVTHLGKANWAPYFHPDGKRILFSSNHASKRGFQFNIYMINIDGTGLKQITFDSVFDAFPMFSWDGKYLVFSSNRHNNGTYDTNVFIAEWVE